MAEGGCVTPLPITPENYRSRLDSFVDWPNKEVSPAKLAHVGFVYTGVGDIVQCFQCGARRGQWRRRDIPLSVHQKCNLRCSFLQTLVSKRKRETERARNSWEPLQNLLSDESFVVERRTPIPVQASDSSAPVQSSSAIEWNSTNSGSSGLCTYFNQNATCMSESSSSTSTTSMPAIDSSPFYPPPMSAIPPAAAWKANCPPYHMGHQLSCTAVEKWRRRYSLQNVTAGGPAEVAWYNNTYMSLMFDEEHRKAFMLSQALPNSSVVAVEERMDVGPIPQYNDYYLCRICCEVFINTILMPCRHVGWCRSCVTRVFNSDRRCPYCRQFIDLIDNAILV